MIAQAIIRDEIDSVIIPDLISICKEHHCEVFISSFNGKEDCLYHSDIINEGMDWYVQELWKNRDKRLKQIHIFRDSFKDQIVCLTIIHRKENLTELAVKIEQQFTNKVEIHLFENQYSPGWYWLTIHDVKATKDQAIQTLMKEFGFNPEELIVFWYQKRNEHSLHLPFLTLRLKWGFLMYQSVNYRMLNTSGVDTLTD